MSREVQPRPPQRLLRLPSVVDRTGLSRSTLYELIADGAFPAPVPLGARSVAWAESEVQRWIERRIAARGGVR